MPTNNNINYGPAPLPGTVTQPVLGNNIDRAPAPVPPGIATGTAPVTATPIVPITEQPVVVPVAITNAVIPVTEQPVDLGGNANAVAGPNLTASNQQRYITVLANGAVVITNATSLNFAGSGVSVSASGTTGANITISSGGGNANLGNLAIDNYNIYNTNGQGVVISNFSFIDEAETAYVQIPAGNSTANLNIVQTQGNVRIAANAAAWLFDDTGNLTLPDGTSFQNFGPGSSEWHAGANGYVSLASNNGNTYMWVDNDGAYIGTNWIPGSYTWTFGNTGVFTAPGAINVGDMSIGTVPGDITANANTGVTLNVSGPDGGFAVNYLKEVGNANTSGGELAFNSELGNATYRISLSDDLGDGFATKIWRFDGTGTMTAPGNIVTPTNFVGTNLRTNLTEFNWSESITGIATGATTVVTLANNVFGDPWSGQVTITGVTGTTQANATWWYEAVDSNQFQLYTNSSLSTPVDSSAWGAYVSGGFAVTLNYGNIEINAQNITIRSDHGDYNNKIWTFNRAGQTVFPYMDVARGDNPSGNITGYAMVMGDGTGEAIISTPDGNINGTWSSQRLVINPGKGGDGTSGEGGDIYLWAGRGGDQSGSGGDIKIRGGQGQVAGCG